MPVRIATTRTKASPGLFETLEVLGKGRVRRRLRVAIQSLKAAGHPIRLTQGWATSNSAVPGDRWRY